MRNQPIGIRRKIGKGAARTKKSAASPRILDNRNGPPVGEFLRDKLPGAKVRAVSAYFSIYAHRELREELGRVEEFKFLFGDPRSVRSVDPGEADPKPFLITDEGGMNPAAVLTQKRAALECAEWVQSPKVRIRTVESEFLHGKMFHLQPPEGPSAAVCGSSNFTARGLGFARGNRELNIVADQAVREELREWFDRLWDKWSVPAGDEMLKTLAQVGGDQDPHFIYFLTLYRLFREELEKMEQSADESRLEKSAVWEALYPFQRDAVRGIVSRLVRRGGCVLADSVGLGKTYAALAVLKYFQNESLLVLCPKRLEWNWKRFRGSAKGDNPLRRDNLRYEVHAHTDLGREVDHDWGEFDLVVMDESHNFRNADGVRYSILHDALKRRRGRGENTKVLMLSATPVNTALKDIRNQIHLMADNEFFAEELGIRSVTEAVRAAQTGFNEWKALGGQDRAALTEKLGGVFLKLLDAVSIARSRRQVQKYYADSFAESGGENGKMEAFPERAPPQAHQPETGAGLSYSKIHRDIEEFGLSVYRPSAYLKAGGQPRARLEAGGEKPRFKQADREKFLIGMMRVNFLKRLESSAHSFCLTLDRTIEKIRGVENKIARVALGDETDPSIADEAAPSPDEFAEDDELEENFFLVGKGLKYDLRDMRLDDWDRDLKSDRKALEKIRDLAKTVTPDRDAKLAELREKILRDKATNPPRDKRGNPNRKALVFTAFADTARHLYERLRGLARDELGLHIGLVVGSGANKTTAELSRAHPRRSGRNALNFRAADGAPPRSAEILDRFSPIARGFDLNKNGGDEIDILIATDCVSEGQNLQDCDMVVNYDIHWNPVRIIQRFGRVDRIGGQNRRVRRVDFWPHMNLEEYLKLQERVRAGMMLVEAVAAESEFRERQLRRLREGGENDLTADDLGEFSMNDLIMSDFFLAELRAFLETRRAELENAPNGLFAVVEPDKSAGARPGIVFCLRRKNSGRKNDAEKLKRENRTHPYCLVYVRRGEDGPEIRLGFPRVREILTLFRDLCRGKTKPLDALCAAFDAETRTEDGMAKITAEMNAAVASIVGQFREQARKNLAGSRAGKIPRKSDQPGEPADFELVSWLVIRNRV